MTAKLLKWKIDKIYIYPLGGITKLNDDINKSIKEELLIVLMGPIFQMLYFWFLKIIGVTGIDNFNYIILFFNLLPVAPLDGAKIVNILANMILPYKKSLKIMIEISYIVMVFILFVLFRSNFSLIFLLIYIQLVIRLNEEHNNIEHHYNKFMLERYLKKYNYKKEKIISNINSMYREKRHLFHINGNYISEKQMLNNHYKNKL